MLDRIDIHIEVPRVDYEKLSSDRLGESSASIRERVQAARERQRVRFEGSDIVCPVQEPGLPSRAETGTISTLICTWRKLESSVNWMKLGIAWCVRR
jgi:predicted ATPase with chaperone activity